MHLNLIREKGIKLLTVFSLSSWPWTSSTSQLSVANHLIHPIILSLSYRSEWFLHLFYPQTSNRPSLSSLFTCNLASCFTEEMKSVWKELSWTSTYCIWAGIFCLTSLTMDKPSVVLSKANPSPQGHLPSKSTSFSLTTSDFPSLLFPINIQS